MGRVGDGCRWEGRNGLNEFDSNHVGIHRLSHNDDDDDDRLLNLDVLVDDNDLVGSHPTQVSTSPEETEDQTPLHDHYKFEEVETEPQEPEKHRQE